MLLALDDEDEDLNRRRTAARQGTGFSPIELGVVTGWLRLAASSQASSEWTNWVDVLNSNPGAINSARRPAVAAAANGFPLANFQTNDCVAWSIAASNLNRNTVGYFMWASPDALPGSNVTLISISAGTGGASGTFLASIFFNTSWFVICYVDGSGNGRTFQVLNAAAVGVQHCYGIEYDSSVGGDGCLTLSIDGVIQTTLKSNAGAGGTLGTLPSVTGNILIGNFNDGAAGSPYNGKTGPNIFALNSKMSGATAGLLTTGARAALAGFEVPT